MNAHADTIRSHFEPGFIEDDKVLAALDALLAENQRLRDALDRLAYALEPLDVKIDHSLYIGSLEQMKADLTYLRQFLVDARREIGETLAGGETAG